VRPLADLRAAFSYFSILPVGFAEPPGGAAIALLPFVGAVTGYAAGAAGALVGAHASGALGLATVFGLSIVLTGAVHVDGFMDTCDALFASVTPRRRLEILEDPRHGTYASAFLIVACAIWLAALASIAPVRWPIAAASAAASARWAALVNALRIPDARAALGVAEAPADRRPPLAYLVAVTSLAGALALAGGTFALVATLVALPLSLIAAELMKRRLGGGLTGDVYGFLIVCAEIGLLAVSAR
jgi:adenosylcobinamide-GDP ribazoletransferase